MKEIFYIGGSPCSGKSSVAEALSQRYEFTYYKVDDYLNDLMEQAAEDGCPICQKQKQMNQEQTWMRDPKLQSDEEFAFYRELFPYIMKELDQLDAEGMVVTEGAAFLPELMKQSQVAWDHYYCITPEQDFQIAHYIKREWVPLMVQKCSDPEQAFANWMERDVLFAREIEKQCEEYGYKVYVNDGSRGLEEVVQLVTQHFCLYGRYVRQTLGLTDASPSMAGIFADICRGEVWLNRMDAPSLGVAYSYCVDGYGVAGHILDGQEESAKQFFDIVLESIQEEGKDCFEFSVEDAQLQTKLLALFADREMESEMEYSYRIQEKADVQREIPAEYQIRLVDHQLLQQVRTGQLSNGQMLLDRLEHSWNSDADFFHYSRSYVALKEQQVVGIIFGSARYHDILVVDIEVMQEDRKQGIAGKLAEQFVASCVSDGLTVQWDRVESNPESGRLAERLGFQQFKSRLYYWFKI